MIVILMFGLLLSFAVTFILLTSAFLKVAFVDTPGEYTGAREIGETESTKTAPLRRSDPCSGGTRRLIHDVYGTVCQALTKTLPGASALSACPATQSRMIGVTALESLVIAEEVSRRYSRDDVNRIRATAKENADRFADAGSKRLASEKATCPLMGTNGCCLTYESRPQQCQSWCQRSDSGVIDNAEARLSSGIQSCGLDGNIYELNSALVVALDAPDVSDRWSRGERVFENCQRFEQ